MQRQTITFINRVYPPVHGATGRLLKDLAKAFARDGWGVTIITTGDKNTTEQDGTITIHRVKAKQNPCSKFDYALILLKLMLKGLFLPKPDILVTKTDPPFLVIAGDTISRFKKCPHIHWCQDLYPDVLPALGIDASSNLMLWLKDKNAQAMATCDRIIVNGRCMGRLLSNQGHDPRKITVIPNWANLELITPPTTEHKPSPPPNVHTVSSSKPHKDQIKSGPRFRVLYAGNLGLAHPVETIIEAAAIVAEAEPAVEFMFVGQGKGYDTLIELRTRKHLENIKLMPVQPADRLPALMQSGDIHLISMHEQAAGCIVPSKLYSAFAAGRPCIFVGPAASETAKSIEDFKAGHVLPQGDAETLASTIISYVHDSVQWFSAQEGAMKAAETFQPKQSIETWIQRAQSVLDANKAA